MSCEGVTILIVDDEPLVRDVACRSLAHFGCQADVRCASNGREALGLLRGERGQPRLSPPLVVLTDLDMPLMGGFALINAIREDPSLCDATVFVMTASASDQDRTRARELRVAGYVQKAASPDVYEGLASLIVSRCASLAHA